MRYFLDFKSDDYGKKRIDEPYGMDGLIFSLKQREGSMARDLSMAGKGEMMFGFGHLRKHELKKILYYNRKFGFEAVVFLIIEIDENNSIKYELDFGESETDDLENFKCKGYEDSKLQIVNSRREVKVDLTNQNNIDGDFIGELPYTNMLLLAKPVPQISQWKEDTEVTYTKVAKYFYNFPRALIKSELEDSYTPFEIATDSNGIKNSPLVVFKDNSKNCKIKINLKIKGQASSSPPNVQLRLFLGQESNFNASNASLNIASSSTSEGLTYVAEISKQNISRGDKLWLYAFVGSGLSSFPTVVFTSYYYDIQISSDSTSYNSIHRCYRLSDVMDRVVGSISELNTNKPRYSLGGQFYDNVIMNGNLLRGINTRSVNISLENIEKSISEMHADWEIGSDGKVFFGTEEDFYTNTEVGFFNDIQFSGMNKTFNPKYKINEFLYKYDKFQSQKETTELGSNDEIHGESTLTFFNKKEKNKKELEVGWIRSAFLAEEVRRQGLEIIDNTSTQNDDDIFCFDVTETLEDLLFTEVTEFEHTKDETNNRLILRNSGTVNFTVLGIKTGTTFLINSPDTNGGTYTVFSVEPQKLELTKVSGTISASGNGVRNTNYTYTILKVDVPLTNYTYQGFSETTGLNAAESYSNRRYSVMTNINNYYQSYLATANLYWKEKPLKNTWYKNNPDYSTKYNGVTLREGQDYVPKNPILSPVLYNDIVFANVSFSKFIQLMTAMRSQRGFIRTIDNNQQVIKVYPVDMEFELIKNELRIKAEEKYEPSTMTIVNEDGYILINNETRVYNFIFNFDSAGKLYVYDENRFRLYNGVYWFEVSVNNAIAETQQELTNWLELINI